MVSPRPSALMVPAIKFRLLTMSAMDHLGPESHRNYSDDEQANKYLAHLLNPFPSPL